MFLKQILQQEIFQHWDRDGSGDISVAELTRVLNKLTLGSHILLRLLGLVTSDKAA